VKLVSISTYLSLFLNKTNLLHTTHVLLMNEEWLFWSFASFLGIIGDCSFSTLKYFPGI